MKYKFNCWYKDNETNNHILVTSIETRKGFWGFTRYSDDRLLRLENNFVTPKDWKSENIIRDDPTLTEKDKRIIIMDVLEL